MRAGRPAGRADRADHLALADALPHLHGDGLQVGIYGGNAHAVIEDDRATGVIEVRLGQCDFTIGAGDHRAAGRGGNVDAEMRLARLAVQDALAAVHAADAPFSGQIQPCRKSVRGVLRWRTAAIAAFSGLMRSSNAGGGVTWAGGKPSMRWMSYWRGATFSVTTKSRPSP